MIAGGSIRGEVDLGSNELTPGRRPGVGGSGSGISIGSGGNVLGIGAGGSSSGGGGSGGRSSSGSGRSRDEPRRHTLGGNDHQASLHHQQFNVQLHPLHPHHLPPPHSQYGTPSTRHTTMDLEVNLCSCNM